MEETLFEVGLFFFGTAPSCQGPGEKGRHERQETLAGQVIKPHRCRPILFHPVHVNGLQALRVVLTLSLRLCRVVLVFF